MMQLALGATDNNYKPEGKKQREAVRSKPSKGIMTSVHQDNTYDEASNASFLGASTLGK